MNQKRSEELLPTFCFGVLMKKERFEEIKTMTDAIEHYCRLGFAKGRYSPVEIGAVLHGYCGGDTEAANRLFAVCLLFVTLKANGAREELALLRYVCEGKGKRKAPQKISYLISAYARKSYYDERTVYRRWSRLVSLYSRLLSGMKIKRRQ